MAIRRSLFTLIGLAALGGCLSVLPEPSAPGALYRIGQMETSSQLAAHVVIREPEAPRLFAGRDMVVEGADGGLRLVAGAEWAGRYTRLVQIALIDSLSGGDGMALEASSGAPGDYELSWRVSEIAVSGNRARCALDLTLLDGRTRAPVAAAKVSAEGRSSGNAPGERAQALSVASRACVAKAAAFVATNASAVPSS